MAKYTPSDRLSLLKGFSAEGNADQLMTTFLAFYKTEHLADAFLN
jgi:hypothetical protein